MTKKRYSHLWIILAFLFIVANIQPCLSKGKIEKHRSINDSQNPFIQKSKIQSCPDHQHQDYNRNGNFSHTYEVQNYTSNLQSFFRKVSEYTEVLILYSSFIINEFCMKTIDLFPKIFCPIFNLYYDFFSILSQPRSEKPLYYHVNFANSQGGAKILMESSIRLHSTSKILEEKVDTYMYTDLEAPFSFIVGLTEEVAISEILITSNQMYSRHVKEFRVEGKFTLKDGEWILLGNFHASLSFETQVFGTENKIVRYLRITILSNYEKWTYFTLTQLQVHGKGLFADAVTEESRQNGEYSSQRQNQRQEKTGAPICPNQFDQFIHKSHHEEPHDSNLITQLLNKITELENKNRIQNEKMAELSSISHELAAFLEEDRKFKNNTVLSILAVALVFVVLFMFWFSKRIPPKKATKAVFSDYRSVRQYN